MLQEIAQALTAPVVRAARALFQKKESEKFDRYKERDRLETLLIYGDSVDGDKSLADFGFRELSMFLLLARGVGPSNMDGHTYIDETGSEKRHVDCRRRLKDLSEKLKARTHYQLLAKVLWIASRDARGRQGN
ncbi:MAG: hypothetical protein CMI63_19330 [Parvularcula sp.]|nr:hypothetical protein [Parvularcula sp.]